MKLPLGQTDGNGGMLWMGMWLPETERHFAGMMRDKSKTGIVRGRGTYQKHKLDMAMRHFDVAMGNIPPLHPRRVAVDIGAHVGLWSVWLIRLFTHLVAFEPIPLHARLFRLNVPGHVAEDERGIIGTYELHECALGDRTGTVAMNVPADTTGNATVAEGNGRDANVFDVPLRRLDDYGLPVADFIKIDVEGYELSVLRGAAETIKRCRPIMVLEQKGNDEKLYRHKRNEGLAFCVEELGMARLGEYGGDHILGWAQ